MSLYKLICIGFLYEVPDMDSLPVGLAGKGELYFNGGMSVLKVVDLKKSYRTGFFLTSTEVLKGVSFELEPGTITGFLGGNGAGKTTTMKCLLGLCFPDSGQIEYFGKPGMSSEVKSKIGFLPERPYFYDYLTGEEFLLFYGQLSTNLSRSALKSRISDLLKRVDLSHAKSRLLRGYSKGMLQKVGLAQALIHDPEFVILDEPMSGLDPDGRHSMAQLIEETARQGRSVFFSSHLLHDAQQLCKNLVILAGGQVVYEGATESFLLDMDSGIEVTCFSNGKLERHNFQNNEGVQNFLRTALNEGKVVQAVQPVRRSLEQAFVDKALRAGDRS